MKALLLLIFIPIIMQGQTDTIDVSQWVIGGNLPATGIGTPVWTDATMATRGYNFTITPKNDTIRVIIFYVDTTYLKSLDNYVVYRGVWKDSSVSIGDIKHRVPYVLWQFGYVVYGNIFYQPEYLDQCKRPLLKSIVVFQTIKR